MQSLAATGRPSCRLPAASRHVSSLRPCSRLLHSRPMLAGARLAAAPPLRCRQALRVSAAAAAPPAPGSAGAPDQGGPLSALTAAFPVFVLAAAALGLRSPASYAWLDAGAITPVLGATMLGMGLTLKLEDFKRVLAAPGRILAGFALQYTVMPLMAFAVSRLMGLPMAYAIGLCIVGSCPGGTASNVVAYLAKADVPLSVAMTTASTLGAVVATPFFTQLLLGTLVPVDAAGLLTSTLQVMLLPVLVGAALNSAFPKQVAALAPLCSLAAVAGISLICGSVVAQNAAAIAAAAPKLLAAVFALHAGGFFLGYTLSKALGMPERAARTNSIEVGMQNSALGAVLASVHFAAYPLAAVPCAISACMHSVIGSLLAAVWRGQPAGDEQQAAPAPAVAAVTESSLDAEALAAAQKAAADAAAVEQAKKAAAAATLARIASERVASDAPAAPAVVSTNAKVTLPPAPFSLGSLAGSSGELAFSNQGGSGSAHFAATSSTVAVTPAQQLTPAPAQELAAEDYQAPALGLAAAVSGLYGGRQNAFWPSTLGGSGAASLFPRAIQQAAAPIEVAPTPAIGQTEVAPRPAAQPPVRTGGYQTAALDLAAAVGGLYGGRRSVVLPTTLDGSGAGSLFPRAVLEAAAPAEAALAGYDSAALHLAAAVGGLYGGRPAVTLPAPTAQPAAAQPATAQPTAEDGAAAFFPRAAQEAPASQVPASVAAISYSTAAVGLAAAVGGLYGGQPPVPVSAAAGGAAEAGAASFFPRASQQAAASGAETYSTAALSLAAAVGGLYGGRPAVPLPTPATRAVAASGPQFAVGGTAGTQLPRAVQEAAAVELPAAVGALGASPATALAGATEQLQGWGGRMQPTAAAVISDAAAAEAAAETVVEAAGAAAVPEDAKSQQEAGSPTGLVSGLIKLWERITGSAADAPAEEAAPAEAVAAAPAGLAGSILARPARRPVGGSGAVSFSVQGGSGTASFGGSSGRITAEVLLKVQASQTAPPAAPTVAVTASTPAAAPAAAAPAPKLQPLVPLKRIQPVPGTGGLVFRPTPPEPSLAELAAQAAVTQATAGASAAGRRHAGGACQLRFSAQGGSGSASFGAPAPVRAAAAAVAPPAPAAPSPAPAAGAAREEEKRPLLEVLLEAFTHPLPPQKPKPAELTLTEVQLKRLLGAGDAPMAGERALMPAPLAVLAFLGMSSLLGIAAMAVPAVEFFNSWENKLRSTHRRHLAIRGSTSAPAARRRPAPPPSEPELQWWEMPPVERTSEEIGAALLEALIGKERWWEASPLPAAQPAAPSQAAAPGLAAATASLRTARSLLAALYRSLLGVDLPGLNSEAEAQAEGLAGSTRVRRADGGRGALAFSKQGGSGSVSFWSALKPEPAPKPAPKPVATAAQPYPAVTLAEALSQLQGWGGRTPPSLAALQTKAVPQASANGNSNGNGNGAAHQAAVAAVADALAPAVAAAAKQPLYGQSGATAFSTRGGSGVASFGGSGAARKPTRG